LDKFIPIYDQGNAMTEFRKVARVIEPQMVIEGAGVRLLRSFGPSRANLFDPFLLFDHFAFNDPIEGPITGFPTHPHRGIETVTYMLEGSVRHRDSLGNTGVIGPGAVQWMTSGRGILHEELPRRSEEGTVNGFQLWVNLPAALKMSPPRYQEINAGDIPIIEEDGLVIRLIAGSYSGKDGSATEIAAQPIYMDVTIKPGGSFTLPTSQGNAAIAYIFEGAGLFGSDPNGNSEYIEAVRMAVFSDGNKIQVEAGPGEHVRFVLMTGIPFKEPVVPYGPFVMNTEEEIRQVFEDIRNGTFVQDSAI
jgi:redox-sensitive bicupin YhaK (pirin superfamily)